MLRIRLFRGGKKNQPSYKIVVVEGRRAPKGGRFVDILGFLNPLSKEKSLDKEKAKHWISKGAQPSDTIHNLLVAEGVIKADKVDVKKKSKKKEEEKEEPKPDQSTEAEPVQTSNQEEVKEEPKPSASAEATADKEEKPQEEVKKEESTSEEEKKTRNSS